jgi:hypothetical protein
MNPDNIPQASWMLILLMDTAHWLKPIVLFAGLGVAIWAFLRCRKCGYLVFAIYFALVLFSLLVMPSINRAIRAHSSPDVSEETQKKMDAAVQQAIDKVIAEEGHPIAAQKRYNVEIGPIALVIGLWLLARTEPKVNRTNGSIPQTESSKTKI